MGVPLSPRRDARSGDPGKHQLSRSQRRSGAAAFRGIQLPHFGAGFASGGSGAGRNRAGQRRRFAGSRRLRSAVATAAADSRRGRRRWCASNRRKAADWRLDKDRSVIDLEHTGSFPLNTEVEALLTFATDSESDLNQPDPHALSVREHHSFVAVPQPGYEPLEQDLRVGFIPAAFRIFPSLMIVRSRAIWSTAGACRKKIRMRR